MLPIKSSWWIIPFKGFLSIKVLELIVEPVYAIASAQQFCVSGGGNDKSYLWNMVTGEKVADLATHNDSVSAVAFNHDGKYVASGGLDGFVHVFDTTGALIVSVQGPSEITVNELI